MPFAVAASSVPILAFAPLFNNWFGLDQQLSKAMIAAASCFFPVDDQHGPRPDDGRSGGRGAAALLRRVRAQVFRKLRVPNALPYIFTALRAGGDAGDDRRRRRGVLRGATLAASGQYIADILGVPQLRAVVGGDRVRARCIGISPVSGSCASPSSGAESCRGAPRCAARDVERDAARAGRPADCVVSRRPVSRDERSLDCEAEEMRPAPKVRGAAHA